MKSLRDSIPKAIGNFLVKEVQNNMMMNLFAKLQSHSNIHELLNEPEYIAEERAELNKVLVILSNAQKVLRKDPEWFCKKNISNDEVVNHL